MDPLKIRLLIADDHEMVRQGLQIMLKKMKEIEVVGEADNGEALLQLVEETQPDMVLTDVRMPKMDGIMATRLLKRKFPQIGVIAISSFDEQSQVIDMMQAGAKAHL